MHISMNLAMLSARLFAYHEIHWNYFIMKTKWIWTISCFLEFPFDMGIYLQEKILHSIFPVYLYLKSHTRNPAVYMCIILKMKNSHFQLFHNFFSFSIFSFYIFFCFVKYPTEVTCP
jgi:hypothetical protein